MKIMIHLRNTYHNFHIVLAYQMKQKSKVDLDLQ